MTRASREKGRRAEIELCKLLAEELGIDVARNVDQARAGGADCLMVPGYALEVKRREVLSRPAWWRQAVDQAVKVGCEPMVWYRRNRQDWRALVTAQNPDGYLDVSRAEALDAMRDKLARLYGIYPQMKAAA